MVDQVLDAVRRTSAQRVTTIRLRVGRSSGIVPDSVEFYFRQMTLGTSADGARLEFEEVALQIRCPKCGRVFGDLDGLCDCNAGGEVIGGQDVVLESIDVE
jgi:hydrogenase nickel incorporation protein HypA/HybF